MKKLLILLSCLTVNMALAEQSDTYKVKVIPRGLQNNVTISYSFAGTLCPAGTSRITFAPNGESFTIFYDQGTLQTFDEAKRIAHENRMANGTYALSADMSEDKTIEDWRNSPGAQGHQVTLRKKCTMTISFPPAISQLWAQLDTLDYRGYHILDPGDEGFLSSSVITLKGGTKTAGADLTTVSDSFTLTHKPEITWCAPNTATIEVELETTGGNNADAGIDTIDGKITPSTGPCPSLSGASSLSPHIIGFILTAFAAYMGGLL